MQSWITLEENWIQFVLQGHSVYFGTALKPRAVRQFVLKSTNDAYCWRAAKSEFIGGCRNMAVVSKRQDRYVMAKELS